MGHTKYAVYLCISIGMFSICNADTITIDNDIRSYTSLSNTTVIMTGRSELHLSAGSAPLSSCQIHLNSPDSWLFFSNLRPSAVNSSTYLNQIRVNGAAAALNSTVRIVQYEVGTVVIPHGPTYQPLQVYNGIHFSGSAMNLGLYTYYRAAQLGAMNNAISSFRLKRGYMATFAQESNGAGISKVFIADRKDLEIGVMPPELDNAVSFVRVFPWRWTSKKGWAGGAWEAGMVNSAWHYDWDNATQSSLDIEYVPMRHNANWNSYSNINNKHNVTHALGFNEPDKSDQANMTVQQAIDQWPNLLASGLRLGSPAPSDAASGLDWLYAFIDEADARNYRVDFVAVHFYKNNWSAGQMYNWLRNIHLRTGRPIWITEWNNGCNWTTPHPSYEQNAAKISELITMMDSAPFVERYAIYQWCTNRELISGGNLTPAGIVYRDNLSPMAVSLDTNHECIGYWRLDESEGTVAGDLSGRQNHGVLKNGLSFDADSVPGIIGNALRFDGVNDYIELPAGFDEFDNGFSAAFWAHPTAVKNWARFIDLGNGPNNHNIIVTRESTTNHLAVRVYDGGSAGGLVRASNAIALNTWQFFAVTISNRSSNNVRIYKNGQLIQTGTTAIPQSVLRSANYIGRSNWSADAYYQGALDDVRVFDYALSANEVMDIYLANTTRPFGGEPMAIPGRIEAERFDIGGQGVSYFDTTSGNSGGQYRLDADVDIRSINDGGSGYAVFQIDAGEWLNYTVNITETADYLMTLRASATADNIPVTVKLNDQIIATVMVHDTGSLNTFWTFSVQDIPLTAGDHQLLRLEFPVGGLEVNWIQFSKPGPWNGQPHPIPGRILAEEYDIGGPDVAYDDTTINNTSGDFRY
ncbi:MAG TPA: carbohydrate-binding protein, partial [Phycisphaerales bacterium]|nr:carbohydrate-binding protein [Phycisphaerales bacterium]